MIIPVRCFTCGKVIGNKWETYLYLLQADYSEGWVLAVFACTPFVSFCVDHRYGIDLSMAEEECGSVHVFISSISQPSISCSSSFMPMQKISIRGFERGMAQLHPISNMNILKRCSRRTRTTQILLSKDDVDACGSYWKIIKLQHRECWRDGGRLGNQYGWLRERDLSEGGRGGCHPHA